MITEILLDAIIDCARLVPFLLLAVFLIEYIEHRAGERFSLAMRKAGRYGPFAGALLGCVPQCGFSASCAQMFNNGIVSAGTLVAVFLSTSDEAIPILLANPNGWRAVGILIACKLVIAILTGILLDTFWRVQDQQAAFHVAVPKHDCQSDAQMKNILLATVRHTLSILLYLFLVTLGISIVIHLVGEEQLSYLLLPGALQPLIAAVIGLIPNCASSVLLTQLYIDGMISFGSALSGLCSAAGIGMLVLIRGKRGVKTYAVIIGVTFLFAVIFGSLAQLIL